MPTNAPEDRDRILSQATAYRSAGRPEEALQVVGPLLVLYPGDIDICWHAALALRSLSRTEEAVGIARQAVTASPQDADAWRLLSIVLNSADQVPEAIMAATRAVQLAPLNPAARATAGLAFSSSPRHRHRRRALLEAKEMLRLAPADPAFHVTNGHILVQCNRPNDAERAYRNALSLDPGNAGARDGIAMVHDQRGHWLRAYRARVPLVGEQPGDRELSGDLIDSIGRWGQVLAFLGVTAGVGALMFVILATGKDPDDAQLFGIITIAMASLEALVAVVTAVRLVRDPRLGRLLWSHHRLRVLTGIVGTATGILTSLLLLVASPQITVGFAAIGAALVTVIAIANSVVRKRVN